MLPFLYLLHLRFTALALCYSILSHAAYIIFPFTETPSQSADISTLQQIRSALALRPVLTKTEFPTRSFHLTCLYIHLSSTF